MSCKVRALSKALCVLHLIRECVCKGVCVCVGVCVERKKERDREGERDGMNVFCQT